MAFKMAGYSAFTKKKTLFHSQKISLLEIQDHTLLKVNKVRCQLIL